MPDLLVGSVNARCEYLCRHVRLPMHRPVVERTNAANAKSKVQNGQHTNPVIEPTKKNAEGMAPGVEIV